MLYEYFHLGFVGKGAFLVVEAEEGGVQVDDERGLSAAELLENVLSGEYQWFSGWIPIVRVIFAGEAIPEGVAGRYGRPTPPRGGHRLCDGRGRHYEV